MTSFLPSTEQLQAIVDAEKKRKEDREKEKKRKEEQERSERFSRHLQHLKTFMEDRAEELLDKGFSDSLYIEFFQETKEFMDQDASCEFTLYKNLADDATIVLKTNWKR